MTFDEAFDRTIGHEGGYINDPRDPGGETKHGISKRAYPNEDIAGMTLMRAREIYRRDYWERCQCDQLPGWIAGHVFDASVHSGIKQATLWLQRSVGSQADGVIGAKTIATARRADPGTAISRFNGHRLNFMADRTNWPVHGRGWAKRIASNLLEE
jgi:lysozyme family protein